MATTVTKTIGTAGGRDYASIQAFFDAIPADLVTLDQVWEGVIYPDSGNEFIGSLSLTARVTDATRFVRLKAAPGASFTDNVNKLTNALRCDAANGILISTLANSTLNTLMTACRIELVGLQIYSRSTMTGGPFSAVSSAAQVITARDCILQASGLHSPVTGQAGSSAFRGYNVLLISEAGGCLQMGGTASQNILKSATLVTTNGTAQRPISIDYNPQPLVKNCAIFGFTLAPNAGGGFATGSTGNVTDRASFPSGMSGTTGLSYAAQFVDINTAGGTPDFRPKAGNGLQIATPDSDTTADIIGQTRNTLTATAGAFEYFAAGSTGNITGVLDSIVGAFSAAGSLVTAASINAVLSDMAGSFTATGYAGQATAAISGTLGSVTGSFNATGSAGVSGSLTLPALKNKSGTVWANQAGLTVVVVKASDLSVVATKTGLSTNGAGTLVVTDPAILAGTEYIALIVTTSKAHGSAKLTAA